MTGKSQAARVTSERLGSARSVAARANATAQVGAGLRSSDRPAAPRASGAGHAFGDLRIEAPGRPQLVVGKPDDAYEIEAERAADATVASGRLDADRSPALIRQGAAGVSPTRPGLVQARSRSQAGAEATPDLPRKIENAAVEGHPLPAAQRSAFEERLGHDFSAVRIHDGPAAAAAAHSAGARAFAHGQRIYFGEGQYRPDSGPGQWLLAHELAHTVQQRPNVIARRALETGGGDPSAATVTDGGEAADPRVDETVDALKDVAGGGSAQGGQAAKDRLQDLDTPARLATLHRLQSLAPPAEKQKVAARIDDAVTGPATPDRQEPQGKASAGGARQQMGATGKEAAPARKKGENQRGVELRSPAKAAPVPSVDRAASTEPASAPAPTHSAASAAAATQMQQAVQSISAETPVEADAALGASQDATAAGASARADRPAAATGAQAAANDAMATMAAQLSGLANVRGIRARFQIDAAGPSTDPGEALHRQESDGLAAAFVEGAAKKVESVIAAAMKIPGQALASLAAAKNAVAADTATQTAAVHDGAAAARKKVTSETTRAHSIIDGTRGHADSATGAAVKSARDRAKTAYDATRKGVGEKADTQKTAIDEDFKAAAKPLAGMGIEAGHKAWLVVHERRVAYLAEKNGESTILEGSYHDDKCDARADAAEQVGEEYGKSFRASAKEQADKLPAGKPEVIAKVAEVATKLDDGLGDQFKQIGAGADAFEKGAKAQSRQAGAKIRASVAASAAQTTTTVGQMEEEQAQQIAAQGERQQISLDEAAQSALAAVAGGVARASGQMIESIGSFIASAASMPPPPREELAPALDQAGSQAAGGVEAMRSQLETVGPALAGNLAAGVQGASEGLAAASAAVRQGLGQAADSFAQSATGMTRQAASGFHSLTKANEKTGTSIGKAAEDGFKAALEAAATSFKLFSEKVQETFQTGRQQLLDSLWSQDVQAQLKKDISTYADEAADKVQPRWKKVLKWVITIVIVIAVIAITIASAGALGPVGVILLGAALGAAAGAVQTIANNLLDGKKWSDGVAKAMIVGAISGAVGGAGGVVLKGVGSIGVKIALEAGINVIGGVTGEVVGSVAVGDAVNWEGAVVGALIGAGIGAGLGIAGALKGKIRLGSFGGETPSVPRPRPVVETPPAPAGKLRSALEQAKILAPRPGVPAPEVNIGAATGGEPATPARMPEPAPAVGATPEPAPTAAATPEPAAVPRAPRPGPASELPRALPEPAPARIPPAESSVPDNLRQFESAEPGRAGDQPRLRTQRPMTSADEFAARQRARAGGEPSGSEPPGAEPQIQRQPVAQAAGAEGYAPQQAEPRLQVIEGNAGDPGRVGGGSPLEINASRVPPRPGRPQPATSSGGAESPRGARVAGEGGAEPGGGRPGRARPSAAKRPATQRPSAEPSASKEPAPTEAAARRRGAGGQEGETRTTAERRAQARQDARSAAAERARRDADSAAMQRDFQGGSEIPTRKPSTAGEALSFDEDFGPRSEDFGDIGSPGRARGARSGGPPADLRELPAFPESVKARGPQEALEFFRANEASYPKSIEKQIAAARPGSLSDVENIDALIRNSQARAGNRALGFEPAAQPVQVGVDPIVFEPSSPFRSTVKGHTPRVPGAEFERGATLGARGDPKNLTYVGQTRTTGETVQIDDFDFQTRTPKEIKMPLALKEDPRFFANNRKTVLDQMRRQAQFSKDWNFTKYKWEMYTPEDAKAAQAILRELPPDLAKWIEVTQIE